DMLLAGIMLDTKNFTRTTGEETFAAAVFLKSRGASSEKVTSFFFKDIDAFRKESELYRNMFFYHGGTVITGYRIEGEDPVITQDDRITVSRMAETMLTVHGLEAAFAIVYNDAEVLVSARSKGNFNVQLILEALGGGGRFDAAGAQITGMSFEEVGSVIKEKIDSVLGEIDG
ncbi:MAG: hypothetical protein ILO42_01355, partial [Clostridia bacterium]|nr:hypothetical protein [Clostridia bacterium]